MSRPSWSTPNQWSAVGPVGPPNRSSALEFCCFGSGAPRIATITGAAIATTMSTMMKPSAVIATLSRRSRRQNSCSGDRAVIAALAGAALCVDDDVVIVLLMDEPGRIARAHGRASALSAPMMKMSIPPATPRQFPGRARRNWFPKRPPAAAFPATHRRARAV